MTYFLLPGEKEVFLWINSTHTPFLDSLMWLYSGLKIWLPLVLGFCYVLVANKSWREWSVVLLFLLLLVLACDFVSGGLIKPWIARPRPTSFPEVMELVRTLGERRLDTISFGFISGHTTQAFGIAAFTALLFRNRGYTAVIFIWAAIMGYSRIYLGAHFVSDVLGGILAGILVGFIVFKVYRLAVCQLNPGRFFIPASYPGSRVNGLTLGIAGYVLLFSLLSPWLITYLK